MDSTQEEYILQNEIPPHRDGGAPHGDDNAHFRGDENDNFRSHMTSEVSIRYTGDERIYIDSEFVGRENSEPDIVASVRSNIDGYNQKAFPEY